MLEQLWQQVMKIESFSWNNVSNKGKVNGEFRALFYKNIYADRDINSQTHKT